MAIPILMPKQGNSVESCLIIEWKKQAGDKVKQGEVLLEVETDKAVIEIESPAEGVLLETFFEPDDDVPVQTVIGVIGEAGETFEVLKPSRDKAVKVEAAATASSPSQALDHSRKNNQQAISPRANALARKNDLEIDALTGTGPQRRIIERDVKRALERSSAATKNLETETPPTLADATATQLTGVRKRSAKRMLESLQTTAQLTLNASADASDLLHYRQRFKESSEDLDMRGISLNDLILFSVSRNLKAHLYMNALYEQGTVYEYEAVHLGFAVDTPRGLLVPVIKNADGLGLKALSEKAGHLARDCQDGDIRPEDLQGGTFTVSNLGGFGVETFTPILNPPQVAILGVGGITLKPVQVEGKIGHIPHLSLSLTVDHQVVDGAPAARFLQTLSKNLSSFSSLLLG